MNVKKSKKRKRKANGRPTAYSEKLCQKLIDFFDIEPFEDKEIPHYQDDGKTLKWKDFRRVPNRWPTLRRFAKKEGIAIRTIYYWVDEKSKFYKKEFAAAFEIAKQIREDFLVENGLQGLIPPATFKFVAVNYTKMRDSQDLNLGGGFNLIIVTNSKPEWMNKREQLINSSN